MKTVDIGGIPIDAKRLPNGDYALSASSAANAIGAPEDSLLTTSDKPISLESAICYWVFMSSKGNRKALALIIALCSEAFERRADRLFPMVRESGSVPTTIA